MIFWFDFQNSSASSLANSRLVDFALAPIPSPFIPCLSPLTNSRLVDFERSKIIFVNYRNII